AALSKYSCSRAISARLSGMVIHPPRRRLRTVRSVGEPPATWPFRLALHHGSPIVPLSVDAFCLLPARWGPSNSRRRSVTNWPIADQSLFRFRERGGRDAGAPCAGPGKNTP